MPRSTRCRPTSPAAPTWSPTGTIADIGLYAHTHVAGEAGFDLGALPAIRGWLDRVAAQPGHAPISA